MNVKIEIDRNSVKKFTQTLETFTKETGKSIEDGLDTVAIAAGKRLISTVQPYGMNKKIGEKYMMSIAKQVNRAIRHGNVEGQDGGASEVHSRNRNSRGQVPKGLNTDGRFRRKPVEVGDKESHIDKKQAMAGIAKGAWYQATNQITAKKVTGVAAWITRHENQGNGVCNKTGTGFKREITLTNRVPYIRKIQSDSDIEKSIKTGYSNFIKQLQKIIDKNIEKANA
jgi:hypothetical protein